MLTSTIRKVQYTIAYPFGPTYAIAFPYWAVSQMYAKLSFNDGTADLTLAPGVDFSVTAPGASGTLTKLTDWNHAAIRLTIYREVILDQQTDYRNGETVDMELLEQDFDMAVARDQELQEQIDRIGSAPITDPEIAGPLPSLSQRVSRIAAWDALGHWMAAAGVPSLATSPFMATVLDDGTAEAALGTLGTTSLAPIVLSANATLTKGRRHVVLATADLTLPSAAQGDFVEVVAEAWCRIKQTDAEHVLSHRGWMFTTKGAAGYLQLKKGDRARLTYRGAGFAAQAPAKIADPATLPANVGSGSAWSPDGRYLAFGHAFTPFITIYDWSTGVPVKIADPAVLPLATVVAVAWSPDGRYLATVHDTSPYLTVYDWSTGVPVKIANPATPPTGATHDAAWSPDGRYLAFAHTTTPFLTVYDLASGTLVKIANPATLPGGQGNGATWSPNGGFLAISHWTTPFVTIYNWRGGSPLKIANPATLPTIDADQCAWSPDGRYLVVWAFLSSPFMTVYDFVSGAPVKIDNPALMVANASGAWSPDGRYLACVVPTGAGAVTIYDWVSANPVKISDPTPPAGTCQRLSWSPDGRHLVVGHNTTPFITIYDWRVAAQKEWIVDLDTMFGGRGPGHPDELRLRFK